MISYMASPIFWGFIYLVDGSFVGLRKEVFLYIVFD
jgi:hypothetical protein